jgi:hypothetical protein
MKKFIPVVLLVLLAACQSAPRLEDDIRYIRFARVVKVHVFTDAERKEAAKTAPRKSNTQVGVGVGVGVGSGGVGFGSVTIGVGSVLGSERSRDIPPQVAYGANRFTVQPLHSSEHIEVMSYGKFKVGDCVKLFSGHPAEYARLFKLKPGEQCQ